MNRALLRAAVLTALGLPYAACGSSQAIKASNSASSESSATSSSASSMGASATSSAFPPNGFESSVNADAGSCPGSVVPGGCAGAACLPLIDDMNESATDIPFLPPACAEHGFWMAYVTGLPTGAITTPSPLSPFAYSALPQGPPLDAGSNTASVGACLAGTTSIQQDGASGLIVVPAPTVFGDGGLPALLNASPYQGIQFWLWQALASAGPDFVVVADDEAETSGWGVCDPTATGPTACGGAQTVLTPAAGWQRLQLPWTGFLPVANFGGANESSLDPTTLTAFQFQVEEFATDAASGVQFDFCILDVSFY